MISAEREVIEDSASASYELGALLDVTVECMTAAQMDPMVLNAVAGMARMAKAIAKDLGRITDAER